MAPFDWLTTEKQLELYSKIGKIQVLKASCKLQDKEVFLEQDFKAR